MKPKETNLSTKVSKGGWKRQIIKHPNMVQHPEAGELSVSEGVPLCRQLNVNTQCTVEIS